MSYKVNNIIFTDSVGVPEKFKPQPASLFVPDWYKNMDSYRSGDKKPDGSGQTSATIKRCMPVFDAITAGYIIISYVDVYVSQKEAFYADQDYHIKTGKTKSLTKAQIKKRNLRETIPYYEWPTYAPISFHPLEQAPEHPSNTGHILYPKWINPWSIKTPPGYSTLFVAPMHQPSVFRILEGVVDTDQYDSPVNFPFVLNDITYEGLIPAGTPIAQVIPFRRESWEMEMGSIKNAKSQFETTQTLRTKFFDSYKSQFRQPKEYK